MIKLFSKPRVHAPRQLDPDGPLADLKNFSVKTGNHFEGEAAYEQLRNMRLKLEQDNPGSRCSEAELWKRMALVQQLSEDIFAKFSCVEGVALIGSALRSKLAPNDFDIIVFTQPRDPDLKLLNKYPDKIYKRTDIAKLEEYLKNKYPEIGGIRAEITVEFAKDRFCKFMSIIKNGPFFGFINSGSKDFISFCNLAAIAYLDNRQA